MKREERLREELEEAWFALVVEKIAQQEGAELNALNEQLNNDPQYAVPEELDRRSMETIRSLVAQDKKKRRRKSAGKIFLRVACAAMIASMMLGSAYAVLPSERKTAILNLLVETKDVSTRLVMEDVSRIPKDSETIEDEPKVLLGYQLPKLPEEFVVIEEKHLSNLARIEYSNNAGIIIEFRFCNSVNESLEIDTENSMPHKIEINGICGTMWVKENSVKITWSDSSTNTFISITSEGLGAFSTEEIARGIRIINE